MGEGTDSPILVPILILVFLSVALAGLAVYLRRSGRVTSRGAGLALAILAVAPLFGGGLYLYVSHLAMRAENVTAAGVNGEHPQGIGQAAAEGWPDRPPPPTNQSSVR